MRWNKPITLLLSAALLLAMTIGVFAKEGSDKRGVQVSKTMVADSKLLDINQIECYIQNDGSFGENPTTGGDGFYFPRGQRTLSIIYTAGLWVCGYINGEVRSAVNSYGAEFQPGVIQADGTPADYLAEEYKIYKYNKGDVVDAAAIAQGCPDEVLGDQMAFCVYNDIKSHDAIWGSPPMGIEVQQTAFAYNRTGALGQTVFFQWVFVNKGADDIDSAYVGVFFDPDLGFANDDLVGCDTTLGIGYVFNGDGYDDKYGVEVPAMASDFFQGPMVPAPGETAVLPDGTTIPDSKVLPMTAFFCYINDSPISGMNDPHTPQEGYYFMSGFRGNGIPWSDPVAGETKFPFAGDPVSGAGWLLKDITQPDDMRMGNASGPFDLPIGDEQKVVVGLVVGSGTDNISSVTVMRFYDKAAQLAYDMNFELPSPPPQPIITASPLDGEVIVSWDNAADYFDEGGYVFEGYNVWQGEGEAGPWTKIGTYDKVNGITTIWDQQYSQAIGALIDMPVQFGTDAGMVHTLNIRTDEIKRIPMVNGKPYYFAVTGYAYNPSGVPKILENAPVAAQVVPQRPVLDKSYNAEIGDALTVEAFGPVNEGKVSATVVDPTLVTGHDYQVTIDTTDEGVWVWHLTDETTGEVKLEDQQNLAGDDAYPVVDGVQPNVFGPTPVNFGLALDKGAYVAYGSPYGGGWDWEGDRWITGVNFGGLVFWGGLFIGADAFWGTTLGPTDYVDVRIDFWNAASNTADPASYPWSDCCTYDRLNGYAYNGTGTFPGAAYDVDDPANPRRINLTFVESALADHHWDPVAAEDGEGTGGREYLFINKTDYDGGASYDGSTDGTVVDVLYQICAKQRGSQTSDDEFQMYLYCIHPIQIGNYYTYSSAGLQPTQSAETAIARLDDINVYPNPYFGHNKMEGTFYSQFVTFNNLPEDDCVIRIFSLGGSLVTTIEHNNGTPFERWYLLNENEIPVASGMYIVHIETKYGDRILKLGIINREAYYQHL